jgi:hypothetical protein
METALHGSIAESGPAHSAFLSFYQSFRIKDGRDQAVLMTSIILK